MEGGAVQYRAADMESVMAEIFGVSYQDPRVKKRGPELSDGTQAEAVYDATIQQTATTNREGTGFRLVERRAGLHSIQESVAGLGQRAKARSQGPGYPTRSGFWRHDDRP